jgi:Tfp pilus assembly protein PilN
MGADRRSFGWFGAQEDRRAMIRVNLLPIEEERQRSRGRFQLIIFAILFALEIGGIGALYVIKQNQVSRLETKKAELQSAIADLQEKVDEAKKFREKEASLKKKRDVLTDLESDRGGPVDLLRELQTVLSQPRNQMQRNAQKRKGWNVDWDPSNVWIQKFVEEDAKFEMVGGAMDHSDFAQFLQRLSSADHFENVQMDQVGEGDRGGGVVQFRVTGRINYSPGNNQDGGDGNGKSG